MSKNLSSALAGFSAGLRAGDVPPEVRRSAQWHLVDSIGVAIAGADPQEPSGHALAKVARQWRTGTGATVLGTRTTVRPEAAALLNGSLAQALEMDDKHGSSLARPGSTVTPAVLAVGEDRGATVGAVLTAMVAGYEVMIRLGFVAGKRFLARGYHTSSLIGGFGAAAAVGALTGLGADGISDAFGIAGTFASGIQESTRTGSTSKILHGGWGAHAGIAAVDLAAAGITGPDSVFEGEFGFFRTHLTPIEGELDWAKAEAGLGSRWYLPDTAIKPYPCCQLLHAFIAGVKELLREFAQAGVRVEDIDSVRCLLAEPGLTLVTQPAERKVHPSQPHEARFSLPYVVASALIRGDVDLSTFREPALADPAVHALASKVVTGEDPDSDYPAHCPAVIAVEAGGVTFHKRVPYHPGCPEAPLSDDDVLDKFERNTAWLFGDRARKIAAGLAELPGETPVREALAMVRAGHP
ncbi:MmgE/PrpD family protein [Amycolatopsis pigmentata]|uniref:MmgE/PrpD family protein n=1 Tax=Amycolatopsis pigmentata TaxID=450801 RepID=A0ABW5FQ61_9PSEU